MSDILQDLRYGWRQLRRTPGFTVVAVLTLALGVAVSTGFFAVVDALLYRTVPGANQDLVRVLTRSDGRRGQRVPLDVLRAIEREPTDGVTAVAAVLELLSPVMVQRPGRAEQLNVEAVSGGYANVLGLAPQAGRWLHPDDDGRASLEAVAVISDNIWRNWFGADPGIVGTTSLRLNGVRFRIVGVAPAMYRGLGSSTGGVDLWVALPQVAHIDPYYDQHDVIARGAYATILKMQPGYLEVQSAIAIETLVRANLEVGLRADPSYRLATISDFIRTQRFATTAEILSILATLVLLAACANLANMLYARGSERAGETAVRMSLGATAGRIVRMPLAETGIIALLAAALGLVLAWAGTTALAQAFPRIRFGHAELTLDLSPEPRVFLVAFAAAVGAALLVGLLAAWRSSRILPMRALAPSGVSEGMTGRGGRFRTVLVSVQVTAALLLVMATGLFWEQFTRELERNEVLNYRANFASERIVTGRIDVSLHGYFDDAGAIFLSRAVSAVAEVDGVERVAMAHALPGGREPGPRETMFEPVLDELLAGMVPRIRANYTGASPGLLDVLSLPLLEGRDIRATDVAGAPLVAVVSRSFADAAWPDTDALGRQVRFVGGVEPFTIIGITADPVENSDRSAMRPANFVFLPMAQHYAPAVQIVARAANPLAVVDPIRLAVAALDGDVAVSGLASLEESGLAWLKPIRATVTLMTTMGALALALSMLGIYGVVAWFVARRRHEFGIRLALGATPRRIGKLVFDYTVHVMLVGLLPGVLLASGASRVVESAQFDVMPNQISTWVAVPLLVLASGIIAGAVPAWRASRVDPNLVLRDL